MKHTDFTFLRDKKKGKVFMFYGTYKDFLKEYDKNERSLYEKTPIPFGKLKLNTLTILLENIMEDNNWHARAAYEPRLLADSMLKAGISKKSCENAMRNFITGLEKQLE